MEHHSTLSDKEFENQFSNGTLDPGVFTHEAHLRLAWIHITTYGVTKSIDTISAQLQKFVALAGEKEKFNMTVTVAAIRAVYHFMRSSTTTNFQDFIDENPRLKNNFKELLHSHYSTDIFKSEQAKKEFLEPELLPFD